MIRRIFSVAARILIAALLLIAIFFCVRGILYRRPHREIAEESGVELALVYAVMKAESSFHENEVSSAGAVGLMQILPATAEYVCRMNDMEFDSTRLTEGEYNTQLGCLYLKYLLERFEEETAIAAYNAGEGTVSEWLKNGEYSEDGSTLKRIPYPETARYVKKVIKFRKNYQFFYH